MAGTIVFLTIVKCFAFHSMAKNQNFLTVANPTKIRSMARKQTFLDCRERNLS